MSNDVFANGREVSCKAGSGKTICAFPDVCFTPPENPATPPGVPIPYPNTGMSSDTTSGSKTVKISGKEVMLKNKSYFKKSVGDEAGCAAKKGVVTSVNRGKVYFTAWSMDVKFEGENVVRHLDLTTHNHNPSPGNSPPWAYMDSASMPEGDCKTQTKKTEDCMEKHIRANTKQKHRVAHRKDGVTIAKAKEGDDADVDWDKILAEEDFYNKTGAQESFCADTPGCKETLECSLVPFDFFCCDGKTPHHVVPAHCFMPVGARGTEVEPYPHVSDYDDTKAPCICLEGTDKSDSESGKLKEHGRVHEILDPAEAARMTYTPALTPKGKPRQKRDGTPIMDREAGSWSFEDANEAGCDAVAQVKGCDKECMKQQSANAHKKIDKKIEPNSPLRADPFGSPRTPADFVPTGATPAAPAPG